MNNLAALTLRETDNSNRAMPLPSLAVDNSSSVMGITATVVNLSDLTPSHFPQGLQTLINRQKSTPTNLDSLCKRINNLILVQKLGKGQFIHEDNLFARMSHDGNSMDVLIPGDIIYRCDKLVLKAVDLKISLQREVLFREKVIFSPDYFCTNELNEKTWQNLKSGFEIQSLLLKQYPGIKIAKTPVDMIEGYNQVGKCKLTYCLTQDMASCDLKKSIENPELLSFENRLKVIIDVAETLEKLHQSGYTHRDVHAGNVLLELSVSGQITVELTDFDLARRIDLSHTTLKDVNDFLCMSGQVLFLKPWPAYYRSMEDYEQYWIEMFKSLLRDWKNEMVAKKALSKDVLNIIFHKDKIKDIKEYNIFNNAILEYKRLGQFNDQIEILSQRVLVMSVVLFLWRDTLEAIAKKSNDYPQISELKDSFIKLKSALFDKIQTCQELT